MENTVGTEGFALLVQFLFAHIVVLIRPPQEENKTNADNETLEEKAVLVMGDAIGGCVQTADETEDGENGVKEKRAAVACQEGNGEKDGLGPSRRLSIEQKEGSEEEAGLARSDEHGLEEEDGDGVVMDF